MMVKMRILLLLAAALLLAAGCAKPSQGDDNRLRDDLYRQVCALTRTYADSMRAATDSATVSGLMERYGQRLSEINMKFPPATDMELEEDQNDTIYMLTQRLIAARDKALMPRDTVAADTTSAVTAAEQHPPVQ